MNQTKLKPPDYFLSLIPILIFFYPILIFGGAFFNWYDFDKFSLPLTALYLNLVITLSSGFWVWKIILKTNVLIPLKNMKKKYFYLTLFSCLLIGILPGLIDGLLIFIIFEVLLSLYELEGTAQVLWGILLGFFFIAVLKVLGDLHHLPEVYNNVIDWFHTKLD